MNFLGSFKMSPSFLLKAKSFKYLANTQVCKRKTLIVLMFDNQLQDQLDVVHGTQIDNQCKDS